MYWFKVILMFLIFCESVFGIESPCPGIFEYYYDNTRTLNGAISVPTPKNFGNLLRLDVEFNVGNQVQGFIGKIHLMKPVDDTLQDILHNGQVLYKLEFPQWNNLEPKITKISLNGNQICQGNSIKQREARTITTINLKYSLSVNFPSTQNSLQTFPHYEYKPYKSLPTQQPIIENFNFQPINFDPANLLENRFIYEPPVVETTPSYTFPTTSSTLPPPPYVPPTTPVTITRYENNNYAKVLDSLENMCGLVDNTVTLIAKGDLARKADYPWLGALFKTSTTEANFICGATLVTKKHAITAGHCVHGVRPSRIYIILGRENIYHWLSDGVQIQIKDTLIHQDYIPRQGDADIAMLTLGVEIRLTSTVRPACLWNSNDNYLKDLTGKNGVVVGWGKDENGNYTTTPRKSVLPVVSYEECLRSNVGFGFITSNRTFCAGKRDQSGPCNGDSGSGFYIEENEKWTLKGIVSLALVANDTCDLQNFVVFVDIAQFKYWILDYITL